MRAHAHEAELGRDAIFTVFAFVAAALLVVFAARRPSPSPYPARIAIGDVVSGTDGVTGVVLHRDGKFALIDVGGGAIWHDASKLTIASSTMPNSEVANQVIRSFPSPAMLASLAGPLQRLGLRIFASRNGIFVAWLAVLAVCLPLAGTASNALQPGGFSVRGSPANQAMEKARKDFDLPRSVVTAIVRSRGPDTQQQLITTAQSVAKIRGVTDVSAPVPSTTGNHFALRIALSTTEQKSIKTIGLIRSQIHRDTHVPINRIALAGTAAAAEDTATQAKEDLKLAEIVGIPATLLVLLLVFRSVVAAGLAVVVGAFSVVLSLGLIHLVGMQINMSVFVVNIASMLGFGLAVDYSLLSIARFRDELEGGRDTRTAVALTVAGAGRALIVSGVAVLVAMASLAAIPMEIMRSVAIGGVIVVIASVSAACTLLPVMLALLGPRIDSLTIRQRKSVSIENSFWYGWARSVMNKPGLSIAGAGIVLFALASPLMSSHFEIAHDEVLPYSSPSRVAERLLAKEFGERVVAPIVVIAQTRDETKISRLKVQLVSLPHVDSVVAGPASHTDSTMLVVKGDKTIARGGAQARALVDQLLTEQQVADVEIGGVAASEREVFAALKQGVPKSIILVLVLTFVILGVAFRSVLLPLKAIVLDTLSILAAFGVVAFVFEQGHGVSILSTKALGYMDTTLPIMLFCILFSLSMDYEVFMLAKITEGYQSGLDVEEATARGVANTAPLITGAAMVLIVVGLAFATTGLVLIKQIGFGIAVALALDATIVRFVLLPVLMRTFGISNWWVPRKVAQRIPAGGWAH